MFTAKINDPEHVRELSFTGAMVMAMVYGMTLYNMAWENGADSMSFTGAFLKMWPEAAIAFPAVTFVARPAAEKLKIFLRGFGLVKPLPVIFATTLCTACLMAPLMTLFVIILRNGPGAVPFLWPAKLAVNFPFALCLQLFCLGPLLRGIFRAFTRKWPPKGHAS
ncbi:MAG: hypothetical protein LBP78_04700 [Acidaminococcales bacterium]|jgi:hypothetical protein|nr:hypothetical protein [Acidaminococcales bacterium]